VGDCGAGVDTVGTGVLTVGSGVGTGVDSDGKELMTVGMEALRVDVKVGVGLGKAAGTGASKRVGGSPTGEMVAKGSNADCGAGLREMGGRVAAELGRTVASGTTDSMEIGGNVAARLGATATCGPAGGSKIGGSVAAKLGAMVASGTT